MRIIKRIYWFCRLVWRDHPYCIDEHWKVGIREAWTITGAMFFDGPERKR
jgi:hypothetical protein